MDNLQKSQYHLLGDAVEMLAHQFLGQCLYLVIMVVPFDGYVFQSLADRGLLCQFLPRCGLICHYGKYGHAESVKAWLLDILVHFRSVKFFLYERKHEPCVLFRHIARLSELLFEILADFLYVIVISPS